MKICLINNLYKPYQRGGAERIVELIAEGLQDQGHDVFVITTKPMHVHAKCKMQNAKCKIYYINGLYFNLNSLPKIFRLFWHLGDMFDIGSYFKVKSILEKEKPDIVMTHNLKGVGYLIPRAIKCLGIKHIHTLHDIQLLHPSGLMIYGKESQINSILAKLYANICRWLFASLDVAISPSKWLLEMHANKRFFQDAKKAVLINPTLPPSALTLVRKRGKERGVFRFLYVGQIEDHKGVIFLINTFQILCEDLESNIDCELIIVGEGSKIKLAKRLAGNNENIKLLGRKNKEEVEKLMQIVDCLVVPSLCYENSPTVIYEALGVGLPTIASRIGGIEELIHGSAGILFKPGNEGDLMYQMKWAIKNRQELHKIGELGKQKIKQFSLDNYIRKLIDLAK